MLFGKDRTDVSVQDDEVRRVFYTKSTHLEVEAGAPSRHEEEDF